MHGGGDTSGSPRNSVGALVRVNVRIVNGQTIILPVNVNSTVKDFRSVVTRNGGIQGVQHLLIYNGRVMMDDETLKSLGVGDGAIVDMVIFRAIDVPGSGNANSTSTDSGRLQELVMSALENLANNPEALRILYTNNPRMHAIFDRIVSALRLRFNDCQTTNPQVMRNTERRLVNVQDPNRSHLLAHSAAGRSQTNSGARVDMNDSSGGLGSHSIDQMPISQRRPNIPINPQPQSMPPSNSQIIMQISQAICQVSPEMWQILAQQAEYFQRAQTSQEAAQIDGGTTGAAGNMGLEEMPNSESWPLVLPEELYATELIQLREMGYLDVQENIGALMATAGNIEAAVQHLLERRNGAQHEAQ